MPNPQLGDFQFPFIEGFEPESGVLSTSIRNSLNRERALHTRDYNVRWRGNTDKPYPRPIVAPNTQDEVFEPHQGNDIEPMSGDEIHRMLDMEPEDDFVLDDQMIDDRKFVFVEDDPADVFGELELLMSSPPGEIVSVVWFENWDHRDSDPDANIMGTIKPYAYGVLA